MASVSGPGRGPGPGPDTAGAGFRAALRRCRNLDEVIALLDGLGPQSADQAEGDRRPGVQALDHPQQATAGPQEHTLSVPALTAAVSALPRLPEAASGSGRRRLRRLLTTRLRPAVVAAARRKQLDASGAAIIAATLAQLGPEVADVGELAVVELAEALAEAGLSACRLPPEEAWRPSQQQPGRLRPPPGQYGHNSRSYSTLLYGLAKIGYRPDERWLASYTSAAVTWLPAFPPRDLASAAWALGTLGYRPSEAWLSALLDSWPLADGTGAGGGEGGGAGAPSSAEGGPEARRQRRRGPSQTAPDAHSLSLLVWALWRLGVAAPPDWLDAALSHCARPAGRWHGASSGAPFASAASAAAGPFPGATCQSLGLLAYCVARAGHTPPAGVQSALLEAAGPLLQRGSAQDLALLLAGVAHWPRGPDGRPPAPAAWLQQLCYALQPQLVGCKPQALVLALVALAHLRYSPGAAWLAEHEAATRVALAAGRLDGRAAARLAAAWAQLPYLPSRNLVGRLLRMLAAAGGAKGDLSARLFAEGLQGVAMMVAAKRAGDGADASTDGSAAADGTASVDGTPPPLAPLLPPLLFRSLLEASKGQLPHGYADHALMHLRAWRLLRLCPPHAWTAALAATCRDKLAAAAPSVLVELMALLAWPGWRRFRAQSSAGLSSAGGAHRASDRGPGPLEVGRGHGGLHVSTALLESLLAALGPALPELSLVQLADVVEAVTALRLRPRPDWAHRLAAAVHGAVNAQAAEMSGAAGDGSGG
ncbi:hypothetical protein HYH03_007448 [Edaphochlamys debaryana]|uniref:Uncharacterized protein n=1 Tax=Edaphochlamys debaryana TaxID=47281 RepID=A0A836BZ76_9CHLO|nr:hypothetical protein HYH03_007448 [Edaphochlamys debaryana]|eukprot:KAG2494395.1 hypothetical protein HYH03_007448 [Edaphochlamys debaryana]